MLWKAVGTTVCISVPLHQCTKGSLSGKPFRDATCRIAHLVNIQAPLTLAAPPLLRTGAIIVSTAHPLVYTSNIIPPHRWPGYWSTAQGCQNPVQFFIVLKQIESGGGTQKAQQHLSVSRRPAVPAVCFTVCITPHRVYLLSCLSEWHFN